MLIEILGENRDDKGVADVHDKAQVQEKKDDDDGQLVERVG